MQKALLVAAAVAVAPLAMAHNSQGPGCGLGQQVFEGQSGLFAHTAAATTNGTAYNQLFGLTSGTSNCNGNLIVSVEEQKQMFVASNFDSIAREAAQGSGEHLSTLASLAGVTDADRDEFFALIQQRHSALFTGDSAAMLTELSASLAAHPELAKYA